MHPFLCIGVMQPNLSSSGKYPWFRHKLKMWDKYGLIISLTHSRIDVEMDSKELELFNWVIAVSTSLSTIGITKNELEFLFFKYEAAFLSDGATSDANWLAILEN